MLHAALVLAALPAPQTLGPTELVMMTGQVIPGPSQSYELTSWGDPSSGAGGGWVTSATVRDPSTGTLLDAIVGERPSQFGQGPRVLALEGVMQGEYVDWLARPSMANGRIAFLGRIDQTQPVRFDSVWLDGQLIFREDDTIPGTNKTWFAFGSVSATTTGGMFIASFARGPGVGLGSEVLFDTNVSRTVFETGDAPAGLPGPIERIQSYSVSPDGSHWAAIAVFRPPHNQERRTILVDGEVLELGSGFFVSQNRPVPPAVEAALGATTWSQFARVGVNDEGVVAFGASRQSAGQNWNIVVRDGLPVTSPGEFRQLTGIDERGVATSSSLATSALELFVENEPLTDSAAGIDVDGDGVADAGWSYTTSFSVATRPNRQGFTLVRTVVRTPSAFNTWALLRARDHRIDRESCAGVANSTGRSARMVAAGSPVVAENDVVLQALQLPPTTTGYFLIADSAGPAVNPSGSSGELCLGGSIGRMLQQVFVSNAGGQGHATLDLDAIPRPTGTVAAMAGETWHAQAWFRDTLGGSPTSNFTGAVSVTFE